jgi:AraC family transcriptional activator of mtrCDE
MSHRPASSLLGGGMDVLSEVVESLRLKASVFLHSSFCNEWAIDVSHINKTLFHVIAAGNCWFHTQGRQEPIALHTGDLIILPRNELHILSNSREYPADEVPRNQPAGSEVCEPSMSIICGTIDFARSHWNPLLDTLPEFVIIPGNSKGGEALSGIISYMVHETRTAGPGSAAVIDRLSDVLFVQALRTCMADQKQASGYLTALADKKLGKALAGFHAAPADKWTVEILAEVAGMSRSSFAEHFTELVAMSPIQYVTGWRLQQANDLLISSTLSTAQIAETCGYHSESSFSKAFKKQFDKGPGAVRRESRETAG